MVKESNVGIYEQRVFRKGSCVIFKQSIVLVQIDVCSYSLELGELVHQLMRTSGYIMIRTLIYILSKVI